MEFMQLGVDERRLLLKALDIDTTNLSCEFCKEKVSLEKCGIFPSLPNEKKDATILCDSPMCIIEYLTKVEGDS